MEVFVKKLTVVSQLLGGELASPADYLRLYCMQIEAAQLFFPHNQRPVLQEQEKHFY